ncbi:GntR family transcriptional regulator [Chelativorans sp. AA-79]|uniref:GntR family transcriptional regulator n=1 Tax=Chelativorans sp. AA-79 TaxID=3028735 RepID=UPI0023F9CBAC|nr:GntR family transcriptional regulator [Chelativorans sp. AA-79]WEX09825.1 GntR family transcriptional regulator [Chelativorans sp. AA-79]
MDLLRLNRPESLSEMALRELRNAIIEGRLKLGDQVSEIRLSKMLGISKTPVREALQELRREGLVQIDPQRGTSIFRIEEAEIDQIAEFRRLLELAAARRIMAGDRSEACRRMRIVVNDMHKALADNDFAAYRKLDAQFHLVLIECCGNGYIRDGYGLIAAKIGALRTRAHDDRHVVDRSLGAHTMLCGMLETGDEQAFCTLLSRHIENTGRDYRAWLERQGEGAARARDATT